MMKLMLYYLFKLLNVVVDVVFKFVIWVVCPFIKPNNVFDVVFKFDICVECQWMTLY